MPVSKIPFITRADKNCPFNLYGERERFNTIAPDDNFDIENVEGVLNWVAEITTSQSGIHGIDLSGRVDEISFVLVIWKDEGPDEENPMTIDTKDYEVVFDIAFTEYKELVPTSVDIDLRKNVITIS